MPALAPERPHGFLSLLMLAVVLAGASASAQSAPSGASVEQVPKSHAPFRVLDNIEGPWVNLGIVPVRPMLLTSSGLYAINAHANVIVRFQGTLPLQNFAVPWGPVALGVRQVPGADELLVVCSGNHVLVRLDRLTGATLSTLELPCEPADLLVDSVRDRAYVAITGEDSVVEIDLATNQIVHTYKLPAKRPVFLSFDAEKNVLVAPQCSGNNSGAVSHRPLPFQAEAPGVIDFATNPFVLSGLPDEDLFRIDPNAQTIEPVAKATGAVLFAHAVHPLTGKLWQLNTEANNKDPERQSEALVRGDFIVNRLTIVDLPAAGGAPSQSHTIVNLDDTDAVTPDVQYDSASSVGQPCGLAFAPTGHAAICGLLTDNVVIMNAAGQRVGEIDLPAGSIPRAVAFDATGSYLFVYSWGRNRVDVYRLGAQVALVTSLGLGFDPTPPDVKAGRELYYSARFSEHNNASCASCHVEGRTDMLLWNLSDVVRDNKGPMMTQPLSSIERNGPMHWRGERKKLSDFNGAFDGLLGGPMLDTTPGGEFDQFEAFVFSIQSPANPLEDPARLVADQGGLAPPPGSPVSKGSALRGQTAFFEGSQIAGRACNACHTLPVGSSGDIVATGKLDPNPRRTHMKVPAFTEIWRKEQPLYPVTFLHDGTQMYPVTGGALTHAGRSNSMFDFLDDNLGTTDDVEKADLLAFVSQIDQGIAPAVHRSVQLSQATHALASFRLIRYLMPQARARNVDIAVFGRANLGQGSVPMRWAWNRTTDLFDAENSNLQSKPLAFFLEQASHGDADLVFVGLPVGMARPFGIDYDDDGLVNRDELARGTGVFVRDSDDDGFTDGYEVTHGADPLIAQSVPVDTQSPTVQSVRILWVTATTAAVLIETDEPTWCQIAYSRPGDTMQVVREGQYQRVRRVLLTGLVPSSGAGQESTYTGSVRVLDESGLEAIVPLPTFEAGDFFFKETTSGVPESPFTVVVGDLRWVTATTQAPGSLQLTALARIDKKLDVPAAPRAKDHVVIASVLINGVRTQNFTSTLPTQFLVMGEAPVFPGPFVMSMPTGDDGGATLNFDVPNLTPGDKVTLLIEAVATANPALYNPLAPNFGSLADPIPLGRWSYPDTPAAARSISFKY